MAISGREWSVSRQTPTTTIRVRRGQLRKMSSISPGTPTHSNTTTLSRLAISASCQGRTLGGIHYHVCARHRRQIAPRRRVVGSHDGGRAAAAGAPRPQARQHGQPDRPRADHQHILAAFEPRHVHRVMAHRHRFRERRVASRSAARHRQRQARGKAACTRRSRPALRANSRWAASAVGRARGSNTPGRRTWRRASCSGRNPPPRRRTRGQAPPDRTW